MKQLTIILFLKCCLCFAQNNPDDFCSGNNTDSYFTLLEEKIILYGKTFFIEKYQGDTILNQKKYHAFIQLWENGNKEFVYIREEDGRILAFEEFTTNETILYDEFFEIGHTWLSAQGVPFTLLSYDAMLSTPYCEYTGLMSIKVDHSNGRYFIFYYKQGIGYVGSTDENNDLISCMTPLK